MKLKIRSKLAQTYFSFSLFLIFSILLLLIVTHSIVLAQDDIKTRVFKDVDILLAQAEAEQANLLSPEKYKKAIEKHEKAIKDFDKGKSITDKVPEITEL